jgi:hypothetical protein
MVEGVSGFRRRSRGRISDSIRRVQAQDGTGLLEPGLQPDVSERLARSGSRNWRFDQGLGDGWTEEETLIRLS